MDEKVKCTNCGKEMQEGMKYCPYCGKEIVEVSGVASSAVSNNTFEKVEEEKHVKRSIAGIIGILGVIIGCIGMFMPFFTAWGQKISYYGLLMDYGGEMILVGIISFAVIEMFLFFYELNGIGNILGIIAFLLFLYNLFGDGSSGMSVNEIMNYVDIGFWVMCVGLIMISVSSIFGAAKK